jgi:hypothetical protein
MIVYTSLGVSFLAPCLFVILLGITAGLVELNLRFPVRYQRLFYFISEFQDLSAIRANLSAIFKIYQRSTLIYQRSNKSVL